jgi:hypothetical protein
MKKRGFLLAEETLKIILAVIAIGFLVYLLFSLYNANKASEELELAKASLNHLAEEINSEKAQVEIYNPEGWFIISWPSAGEIPLSCSNLGWQNCICICDEGHITKYFKSEAESCDATGACLENAYKLDLTEKTKIKEPPITLDIDYENKEISELK